MKITNTKECIDQLLYQGIINQEEWKKATTYLNVNNKQATDAAACLEWLIQNRAVSREREETVRAAFATQFSEELTPTPVAKRATTAATNTHLPNFAHLYQYSMQQLDTTYHNREISEYDYHQARNQLKNSGVAYIHGHHLIDLVKDRSSIYHKEFDMTTAMQLFSLLQDNLLYIEDYLDATESIIDMTEEDKANTKLPFQTREELLFWLIDSDSVADMERDLVKRKITNDNRILLDQLKEEQPLSWSNYYSINEHLKTQVAQPFSDAQTLLDYLNAHHLLDQSSSEQQIKSQKKPVRVPWIFILITLYILFNLFGRHF